MGRRRIGQGGQFKVPYPVQYGLPLEGFKNEQKTPGYGRDSCAFYSLQGKEELLYRYGLSGAEGVPAAVQTYPAGKLMGDPVFHSAGT
jgi:hypothetical protein